VNYYKHHIGDYKAATAHLTLIEHGAYRQLLDLYYLDEKPLPKETQLVFRRLCARTQDEQNAVEIVLREFFQETENGWMHKRCESELAQYSAKADANRENGKRGGRPKKTQMVSDGNPSDSESEPKITLTTNHKPPTTNQEPEEDSPSENKRVPRFNARKYLVDKGVDEQNVNDWLAVRKQKGQANTLSAMQLAESEALKAGVSLNDAIRFSAQRSYAGFKAAWLANEQSGERPSAHDLAQQVQRTAGPRQSGGYVSKQEQLERNNRAVVERFAARLQAEEAAKGNSDETE
jgi:uncharacterized protein YdaU (DUF1376 family)